MQAESMPTILAEAIELHAPERKLWTRGEFERLGAASLIDPERFELMDGELILKVSKHRPHVNAFSFLYLWLLRTFGDMAVNGEAPIDVHPSENRVSEPVPDLIVLNRTFDSIPSGNPAPSDLNLVVEISDTSLHFDLTTKAGVYARAGIIEYWVLDIQTRRMIVHRDPVDGTYRSVLVYGENEAIAPLAAPDAEFRPSQAFVG